VRFFAPLQSTHHLVELEKTIAVSLINHRDFILSNGQRSELALAYLKKEGFTKLSHLEKRN
jgi:hypothetical protein